MALNASISTEGSHCPLCFSADTAFFARLPQGLYWLCHHCHYTFLAPKHWLTPEDEAAHYRLHDNRIDDPHYLAFLSRLSQPLMHRLTLGQQGIDMGCGPGPALAHQLSDNGFPCTY